MSNDKTRLDPGAKLGDKCKNGVFNFILLGSRDGL